MCDKNKAKNMIRIDRLKALIDTKTRETIAAGIGCDTSLVTKHYNEDRAVTIDYLLKYSGFFGVSSDYLLGLSNASNPNDEIQFISRYTGLSGACIEHLHYLWSEDNTQKEYKADVFSMINETLKEDSALYSIIQSAALYRSIARNEVPTLEKYMHTLENVSEEDNKEDIQKAIQNYRDLTRSLIDSARLSYYDSKELASKLVEGFFLSDGNISASFSLLLDSCLEKLNDFLV